MTRKSSTSAFEKQRFQIAEAIIVVVVLFIMALVAVIGYQVFSSLNDDIQADDDISSNVKDKVDDLHSRYPSTMDGAFMTAFGLLFLLALIAAFFSDSHPVFLIVIIILLVFLLLAAGLLSNSWEEFSADDELASFASSFPMTGYVLDNLLLVIGVVGLSVAGVMFMKNRYLS